MALFKTFRGKRADLGAQELRDGFAYFCTDDGTFHIDFLDTDGIVKRKQINAKDAETLLGHSIEEFLIASENGSFAHGDGAAATGTNSYAGGYKTLAGGKGFKITGFEDNGNGTGKYTLSSVTGLETEMRYSAVLSSANYNAGKIIEIVGNVVTVDGYKDIEFNSNADNADEFNVYNFLTIVDRPDLGDREVGFNAHTEGENTIASNKAAHAEGSNTKAIGKFAHAEGNGTIAGHAAHAEGQGNTASGWAAHAEGYNTFASANNAHTEGDSTTASGNNAHAEGYNTFADGWHSHAEGENTIASNKAAHAEGSNTKAIGKFAHAEGNGTIAGHAAHAEGQGNTASGWAAHAEGEGNTASGWAAHAEGGSTQALGDLSHSEGNRTKATGNYSHTEGDSTTASANNAHAEGYNTFADGEGAHSEGIHTKAIGEFAHAEGEGTLAEGEAAHAEGYNTKAIGRFAHAEGEDTLAEGEAAHAEGGGTQALGALSHSEGIHTKAIGEFAHAEGDSTTASGNNAHAEGYNTFASANNAHAEGEGNTASANNAHAEGEGNTASGWAAHAEGEGNTASGWAAHAEGYSTQALGDLSHSEGHYSKAYGEYSHAGGQGGRANKVGSFAHGKNVTADADHQAVFGTFNKVNANAAFIIGNGTDDLNRSNALEVSKQGDVFVQGNIYVQGTGDKKNTLNELVQKSQLNRLESTVTSLDTTLNAVAIDFITDENVAYKKIVPEDVLPYASITKVGGVTYVDSERVVHPKVNNIGLTSTQDLVELVPQSDLNLVSTEYPDRSVDISILDTKTIKIKGFNNVSFYSDRYGTSVTKYEFGPIMNTTSAVFPAGEYSINYSSIYENETSYLDVYLKYKGETVSGNSVVLDNKYTPVNIPEAFTIDQVYICTNWIATSEHRSELYVTEIEQLNTEFIPTLICTTTNLVIELPVENLPEEYCYGMGVTTSTQTYSNYIDLESKQFVKHCNTAELTGTYEGQDLPGGVIVINSNVLVDTLICLDPKLTIEQTSINENLLAVLLTAKSNDIEDVLEYVKNMYNQGTPVKVLYAVKQPKIYNISELLTSVEDYIEVYPGDTLIFNNQEEVPVFSSIEYQLARQKGEIE